MNVRALQLAALALVVLVLVLMPSGETEPYATTLVAPAPALAPAWSPYARSDRCAAAWPCAENSPEAAAELVAEAKAYEKDSRFARKIAESRGERKPDPRQPSILKHLKENVLRPGMSVLDLGCAAGNVLRNVRTELEALGGAGFLAGVDLVCGWIRAASEILPGIHFACGDVTVTRVIPPGATSPVTFDLIMMNDAMEHIQSNRYGCLWDTLATHTHAGSMLYFHIPTPETQVWEQAKVQAGGVAQFYENIIPHQVMVSGLACYGFQLRHFSLDVDTMCGSTTCMVDGTPKYVHLVFQRPSSDAVLGPPDADAIGGHS